MRVFFHLSTWTINSHTKNKLSTGLLQKLYYCQRCLLLQEVYYKKQGRKKKPNQNLQTARKKARVKEKNLSEIYKKERKRQGRKKNPKQNLQRATKKKKPKQRPVNFLRQTETFEWRHVCYGPRISRLYDSHPDDSWPDTFYYKLVSTKRSPAFFHG